MKKLALIMVIAGLALGLTATASAGSGGKFVGHPQCTADNRGNVSCAARVAGLSDQSLVFLWFQTTWACVADPNITIVADNGPTAPTGPVRNGRLFTVTNGARTPQFYEIIFQTDFGCSGDAWTVVRYTNVRLQLFPNTDVTYDIGTLSPS